MVCFDASGPPHEAVGQLCILVCCISLPRPRDVFDAHTRSFGALGRVPRNGIYDTMKTAVHKINKGAVNDQFAVVRAPSVDPDFCNVASGWKKGIIEKNAQNSRRCIWLNARDCMSHAAEELNAWLGQSCHALWSELQHPQ